MASATSDDETSTSSSVLGGLPSQEQWEQSVREAMQTSAAARLGADAPCIAWTPREGGRWDLHGPCPRCHDETSKIVSDLVLSDEVFEAAGDVSLNWACACQVEHRAGRTGCGAGEGYFISVSAPRR